MPRKYNRFNWIACVWIVIGLFDLLVGLIIYVSFTRKEIVDRLIIVNICGAAGLLICLGWMAIAIQMNSRYWIRLNWIGILAVFWGIIHTTFAAAIFIIAYNAAFGPPQSTVNFIVILLSSIASFQIFSGIYVLQKEDLYLQFRWRD